MDATDESVNGLEATKPVTSLIGSKVMKNFSRRKYLEWLHDKDILAAEDHPNTLVKPWFIETA